MAKLLAVTLGENRKFIDQTVDAEWFENLQDELDIESIIINGVECAQVLTSSKTVGEWVEALEEGEELQYETEAYLAFAMRYWGKDPDINTIIEGCENRFVDSRKEEGAEDAKKQFGIEQANEFLESLREYLPDAQANTVETYFDYDSYTHDLLLNEYDAVEVKHTGYSNYYFFTSK